jgi:hypothetical protein
MPTPTFSIGRDATIVIQGPFGPITLNTTEFKWQDNTHDVKSRPLSSKTQSAFIPDYVSGSFAVDRNSAVVELLTSQSKAVYYGGGAIPRGTIFAYITNPDQSQTRLQFNDCVFRASDGGTFKQDDAVKVTVEWNGSDMAVF